MTPWPWRKLGRVYVPSGRNAWARSHALLPTVDVLDESRLRVYFASLDDHNFGRVGYVDVDARDPLKVLHEADRPVLDLGELGTFDDCGVVPSCVVTVGSDKYLYYIGFQRAERVPYMLFTGLAISRDRGQSFQRYACTPILDRSPEEPFSRGAPFVERQSGTFVAWYWSCGHWSVRDGGPPHYNTTIRRAVSDDGIHWPAGGTIVLQPEIAGEYSVGRPWIVRPSGIPRMWYSSRSMNRPYRLGYAEETPDGSWKRRDDLLGIEPSNAGWDSDMTCYPSVVRVEDNYYLFYNGNGHGRSGFGVAVCAAEHAA